MDGLALLAVAEADNAGERNHRQHGDETAQRESESGTGRLRDPRHAAARRPVNISKR
jgi:hypothetical protein